MTRDGSLRVARYSFLQKIGRPDIQKISYFASSSKEKIEPNRRFLLKSDLTTAALSALRPSLSLGSLREKTIIGKYNSQIGLQLYTLQNQMADVAYGKQPLYFFTGSRSLPIGSRRYPKKPRR